MRGIDFIQIPTTLLSQVDASVGGKTGVNFLGFKNLIGTFSQPKAVIIDINTLSSLPKREYISGFGEIIKHAIILDKEYFKFVISKKTLDFTKDDLVKIIEKSCLLKASVIEKDEKEKDYRKILNFGHTIGHAIESLSQETKSPLLHGEAISIGMAKESYLANLAGLLSSTDYKIVYNSLQKAELPINYPKNIQTEKIYDKIIKDKKNQKGKILWTLIKEIGDPIIDQEIDKSIILKTIK